MIISFIFCRKNDNATLISSSTFNNLDFFLILMLVNAETLNSQAILSKILPERKCVIDLKGGNRMVLSPGCKPDVLATSLHRIPPASVEFFWKYEAWHYLAETTQGFC